LAELIFGEGGRVALEVLGQLADIWHDAPAVLETTEGGLKIGMSGRWVSHCRQSSQLEQSPVTMYSSLRSCGIPIIGQNVSNRRSTRVASAWESVTQIFT
jgi:hypothetical protein